MNPWKPAVTAACAALALTACGNASRPDSAVALPPQVTPQCALVAGHEARIAAGHEVYRGSCIRCHGADGRGMAGSVPPLAGSTRLAERPMLAVNAVVTNQTSLSPVHRMQHDDTLAALGSLTDTEIADVLSYVMTAWGNCHAIVEKEQVSAHRAGA